MSTLLSSSDVGEISISQDGDLIQSLDPLTMYLHTIFDVGRFAFPPTIVLHRPEIAVPPPLKGPSVLSALGSLFGRQRVYAPWEIETIRAFSAPSRLPLFHRLTRWLGLDKSRRTEPTTPQGANRPRPLHASTSRHHHSPTHRVSPAKRTGCGAERRRWHGGRRRADERGSRGARGPPWVPPGAPFKRELGFLSFCAFARWECVC